MMTDESVVEWAKGWLRENPPDDPTFQQRFAEGLASELRQRADALSTLRTAARAVFCAPSIGDTLFDAIDALGKLLPGEDESPST